MICKKFCKGGVNTKYGLKASGLSKDTIKTHKLQPDERGHYNCPLGCVDMPTSKEAADNIIATYGSKSSICYACDFRGGTEK